MNIIMIGHQEKYIVETTIQIFFPVEKFNIVNEVNDDFTVVSEYSNSFVSKIYINKIEQSKIEIRESDFDYGIKKSLFLLLKEYTNYMPMWGMLTGIRPSKAYRDYLINNSDEKTVEEFKNKFFVNGKKSHLAIEVAKEEEKILKFREDNLFSLYVGIPFCPTKCGYCSFTSFPIDKYEKNKMCHRYLALLCKEIEWASKFRDKIYSIYIGGGTPTSLNEHNLELLLSTIKKNFDIDNIKEYSLEGGRPDTLNENKLAIIKGFGVTRLSINTQTANNDTLEKIGRRHTFEEFLEKYKMAVDYGFDNINIDLIFGLPGENINNVKHSIDEIIKLNPASITTHVLSIKRGSEFIKDMPFEYFKRSNLVEDMNDYALKIFEKSGLRPYYMYRQKNMVASGENIGYCKKGFEGIYNTEIMSDEQNIIGLGAGSTSKRVDLNTGLIERAFNFKSPEDYINRFEEQIIRKEKLFLGGQYD